MMEYQVEWYDNVQLEEWDQFIYEKAVNGTVLQTRKFLSYHPSERFKDCSVIVRNKGAIVAVCPACELFENRDKIFMSHSGSTYGGLIVSSHICKVEYIYQLIKTIENFLRDFGFKKIIYKQTPDLLSQSKNDLLDFCLRYEDYDERQELNLFVDFEKYSEPITINFNKGRKWSVKKCINEGMKLKELQTKDEISVFHGILTENLKKYEKRPVHTIEEMLLLRDILKDEVKFWGVDFKGQMAAGAMTFKFTKVRCMHTQYLAADSKLDQYSPMSFLYYSMIDYAMKQDYRSVSWGITMDHEGNLNWNLCRTKESYGSIHAINRIYTKML